MSSPEQPPPASAAISRLNPGFVYDAAMRDQMLPRKPIEKPLSKQPEDKEEQ